MLECARNGMPRPTFGKALVKRKKKGSINKTAIMDTVSNIAGDTLVKAMKELGEVPEERMEMIGKLRTQLEQWTPDPSDPDEEGLTLRRVDDDKFLLRFLRARKFNIERATKLFVNYYKYRQKYSSLLGEITPEAAAHTLEGNIVSVLPHCSKDGSKMLVARFGAIDLDLYPLDDMLRMLLVILDKLIEDEETQVHGIAICEDLAEMSLFKMLAVARKEQVAKGVMFELIQVHIVSY